jgi:hypothetical protein
MSVLAAGVESHWSLVVQRENINENKQKISGSLPSLGKVFIKNVYDSVRTLLISLGTLTYYFIREPLLKEKAGHS